MTEIILHPDITLEEIASAARRIGCELAVADGKPPLIRPASLTEPADDDLLTIQGAAGILKLPQRDLFALMRQHNLIDHNNEPHPKWVRRGYLFARRHEYSHPQKGVQYRIRTLITKPQGMEWLTDIVDQHLQQQRGKQ